MHEPKDVAIYTRGIGLPGFGAYGAILVCDGRVRELSGGEAGANNNRMDLLAAVDSLGALKWPCRVKLYNANGYLIDGMTKGWAERWQEDGWTTAEGKPTAHMDLWEKVLALCADHEVEFVWIPTSEGLPEYRRCDRLAREFVARQVRQTAENRARPGRRI
jgi:ribonuclease HI